MSLNRLSVFSCRWRSVFLRLCGFTGILLACILPALCFANRPSDDLRSRVMERLDETEADRMIRVFRLQNLEENFCFKFQLEHKPRRGRTVRYDGIWYGSKNVKGPISLFRLFPEPYNDTPTVGLSPVELIVQNGAYSKVWIRRQISQPFELIDDDALFKPIFDGILYTPFDLQMPFMFWNDYTYDGPSRVLSRIAHNFLMSPPTTSLAEENGVNAVRVAIDDTYYALLRAEVLQAEDEVRSRFTVRGIKKVQGYYIVKEVELKNMITKDATNFKVKAACVGLDFDDAIFNPNNPLKVPDISSEAFEIL